MNEPLTEDRLAELTALADSGAEAPRWQDVLALLAEVERLRAWVADLEAFAYGCDAEGCTLPHSSWCTRATEYAATHNGCTCGEPWKATPQPHAGHCWLLSPPQSEVEQLRARAAELRAQLATAERQNADLDRRLGEVEHLIPTLTDDQAGVPA